MSQLLSSLLAAGAPSAVALVLLVKIMTGDRRTDRRLELYTHSLEDRVLLLEGRIGMLEAFKTAATSALLAAGLPLPTVVAVPTAPDRSTP